MLLLLMLLATLKLNCLLLVVNTVGAKADVGVANLWRVGKSGCRHDYPNFGKHMPKNYMQAFMSCAPLMFCDKSLWHTSKRDMTWDVFLPCLKEFNSRRSDLFKL